MGIPVTRTMQTIAAMICGIAVIFLSLVAILIWLNPDLREDVFPLVLLFDVVFAYRFFRYWKFLRGKQKIEASPF